MKFLSTKKGKIWTAVILVIALLLGIAVYRFLHPTKVTDALIKRIEYDYMLYKAINYPGNCSYHPIMFCYGVYGGCVPFLFSNMGGFGDEINVAGSTLIFDFGPIVRIWRNGQFCSIEEAYERGWLTAEHIAQIADIHENIYRAEDYSAGDQYWIRHGQD